ncbi:MAG: hypothetical protein ACRDBM_13725 [Sporomusa sp.]
MDAIKKFTIQVEMQERWVPYFLSMLKQMEYNGNIGRSRMVGIYADGDGDFRPKFSVDIDFEKKESHKLRTICPACKNNNEIEGYFYDAG